MKAAVLGSPVAHSLSPVLHRAAYAELGLAGWAYQGIECTETGLPGLLDGCGPEWAGLSLTMPLKTAVLPLLDRIEPLATEVGCANTVVFRGGRRLGYNTDVPGMIAALTAAGATGAGPALILGAGATACSALACLRGLGLTQATAAVRDPARAAGLLAAASRLGMRVELTGFGAPGLPWRLLISTVPAGAADALAEQVIASGAGPPGGLLVLDVVYHPWPTKLAAAAERAGAAVAGGFEFLLQQAGPQVELMTGQPAPLAAMRAAGLAELDRRAEPPG
ncbi:MAG: shikimate dehydrogenase, partial [Actinomycetota bacterium]